MLEQLLVVMGVTFLVMVSPGPDMAVVVRNTFQGGSPAGLQTSAGVLTGNLVHITYCVLGIGVLISTNVFLFNLLRYAGALYLIYLGVMSFRAESSTIDVSADEAAPRTRAWFMQGLINNVLNPKGTLFYLGIFTVVIVPGTSAGVMLILIASMVAVSAVFWLFFVLTLDSPVVRRLLQRGQQTVNKVFGVVLVLLGVRVAFFG